MIIYGSRHAWPFCLFLAWLNSSEYFLVKIHLWPQTEKKISFLNSTVCPHFDELFSSHIWKPRFFNICNILTQCQTVLEFVVFALRELNEIYLIYEFLIFFRNKRKIADKADWGELAWSCVRWCARLCGVRGSVVCAALWCLHKDGDAVSGVDPQVAYSFSPRCLRTPALLICVLSFRPGRYPQASFLHPQPWGRRSYH